MVRDSLETEVLLNWEEKEVVKGKYLNLEQWVYTLDPEVAKFSGYSNFLLTGSHTSSSFPISPQALSASQKVGNVPLREIKWNRERNYIF